jgi:LPXTG-motif cell wall-anchored protein
VKNILVLLVLPNSGGIAPGIIVLAAIALLIGIFLLIWRILSR